ncbi:hydroxypyruvate isomerase [Salinihabitans flavidus]|uniref:Hydroxypyruvate isomerase n=1 Tax=Salinihabitans flavidus TaxID=569882 RepID=A0A1H8UXP7_9RHOB|nr:TIM barrel protein [Salinihabitans flavidus]SEP08010.1 hydroxypyruvate isomerase [Salinihabitans flavidus]
MLRFAADISTLFTELPLVDRIAAARHAGFTAVEIPSPYDTQATEILDALRISNMKLALINAPPPNRAGGARGYAAVPTGQDRFRHDFKRALRFAQVLGADLMHIMAGKAEGPEARETLIDNLRWATDAAPMQKLTIEPVNTGDMPGYFLDDFDLAAEILDAVSAPNLALQFDAYHAQKITGDAMAAWAAHGHRAGHVQIAQTPRRSEPDTGEIDYPAFFDRLDADGFTGFVSAEYKPAGVTTTAGLGWLRAAL